MLVSSLPEAKYLLLGENATEITLSLCPYSVVISFFYSTLHSLIVLSVLADAKY
jgi:hypothetical protein